MYNIFMNYIILWSDIPIAGRNICQELIFDKASQYSIDLPFFREELAKFHCEYTAENFAIFEDKNWYLMFLLKWS